MFLQWCLCSSKVDEREDNPIYELSAESDGQSMREIEQPPQIPRIDSLTGSIMSEGARARMSCWWPSEAPMERRQLMAVQGEDAKPPQEKVISIDVHVLVSFSGERVSEPHLSIDTQSRCTEYIYRSRKGPSHRKSQCNMNQLKVNKVQVRDFGRTREGVVSCTI